MSTRSGPCLRRPARLPGRHLSVASSVQFAGPEHVKEHCTFFLSRPRPQRRPARPPVHHLTAPERYCRRWWTPLSAVQCRWRCSSELADQRQLCRVVQLRGDSFPPLDHRARRPVDVRGLHGVVLTWLIERGAADGVDLGGLPVAMAITYDDDEPGSPDVDPLSRRACDRGAARGARGDLRGTAFRDAQAHFPWAWKPSTRSSRFVPSGSRSTTRAGASGSGSETRSASASATRGPATRRSPASSPATTARRGARRRRVVIEDGPFGVSFARQLAATAPPSTTRAEGYCAC